MMAGEGRNKVNIDYMKLKRLFVIMATAVLASCTTMAPKEELKTENTQDEHRVSGNGIYYWRTVFELNETERCFLKDHEVKRLYLRFFDVVTADKNTPSDYRIKYEAVPNATLAFREPMPEGVEIVPVVYITIDALRLIIDSEKDYASLITERILNMADFNDLGDIHEVQLDCDWTQQTQDGYFSFCQAVKDKLEPLGIQLSCTIRLWQLACACPPVDRGVLMLYNTGNITNPNTQNSILDLDDVKAYLKGKPYDLALDYAYPTYSWYVWFRKDIYMGLFHEQPSSEVEAGDVVRYEYVSFNELCELDSLVKMKLPSDSSSIILYHLDSANLSNYTTDEIRQIYRNN